MKKFSKSFKLFILIFLLISYLFNSTLVINSILNYTNLFITKLFPVVFIIYVFSSLLIDQGIINYLTIFFKNKASIIYIILISLIGGFPSGAKTTKEMLNKGYIDIDTANYLIRFTHFPNPLFILGSLKSLFNNNYPILILLSLIISNFIISLIYKRKIISKIPISNNITFSKSLSNSFNYSLKILINIYGSSIFFILILEIINHYLKLPIFNYVLISGIFDLTKGSFSTSLISNNLIKSILIIIFNSFGSIPIHIQTKSIISDTKINYNNYLISRIMQIPISISLFLLFTLL